MRVLVIGATGRTGRRPVSELLARGHEVTAFARNPSAVTEQSDHLHVVLRRLLADKQRGEAHLFNSAFSGVQS